MMRFLVVLGLWWFIGKRREQVSRNFANRMHDRFRNNEQP